MSRFAGEVAVRAAGAPDAWACACDVADAAQVAAFLASDDARFVQGAALVVDGGRLDRL